MNAKVLGAIELPLAPLKAQRRIVEEIEEQFTQLDAGVAALKRVEANLRRYKAAVLKAAVEGRLTEKWRAEHPDVEPASDARQRIISAGPSRKHRRAGRLWGSGSVAPLPRSITDRIPDTWEWVRVEQLGPDPQEVVQVGPMSMRSRDFGDAGVPVLNVGCVQWGRFDDSKLDFLSPDIAARFGRYQLKTGDLVFTRSGTVGRCAVISEERDSWLMTFHLLRVRPDPRICLSSYLQIVFQGSEPIRWQIADAAIGTTRAGFNTGLLAKLSVPLPPLAEQMAIVSEVASRTSVFADIESSLERGRLRASRLRQSILKRAFEGKLVPQDPTDEPASVLLDRIRADRAAAEPRRTSRKPHGKGVPRRKTAKSDLTRG